MSEYKYVFNGGLKDFVETGCRRWIDSDSLLWYMYIRVLYVQWSRFLNQRGLQSRI